MADVTRDRILPRDTFRSLLAAAIALLTLGGWIFSLSRPELRAALGSQTKLWWVEQLVSLALMVACIGVLIGKRSFIWPAFWLSLYSLIFDLMRWFFEFEEVKVPVPLTVILYALFMWRLWRARQILTATPSPVGSSPPPG
jgi:hypothetical protein